LCEALRDRHPEVRLRAAFMLASLGIDAESAHGALRDALQDESVLVRRVAAAAIEQAEIDTKMHPSQRRYRLVVV
jgi:HEAT repeat protein